MRWATINHLDTATVTATNASENYPVINLYNGWISRRYQSTEATSVITVSWSEDKTCDCFFYAHHNLTALSVVFKDSGGATLTTVTPATINDVGVEYFDQLTTVRSVEATITGGDPVYLGSLWISEYFELPAFETALERPLEDGSEWEQAASGESLVNSQIPLEVPAFTFPGLTLETANEIREQYKSVGIGRPFFFELFLGDREFYPPLYLCFSEPITDTPTSATSYTTRDIGVQFKECR